MPHVTSVGLDVHARSIAAAAFDSFTGEVAERSFGADPAEVAAWILGFESPKAVYESGPTGFHLCRSLRKPGVGCVVGAVSKMRRPAADLSRALDDAREDLQRARQRLSKFLLRRGHVYDEVDALGRRRGAWTRSFWRWAYGRVPEGDAARDAFVHYATCVRCAESDKRALERAVAREAASPRWKQTVDALSCIKGIDTVTAFCLASEAGVFSRFRSAPAYASWLGLTPSEHSSGEREARGGIIKAGNAASRRAPVEAAWHYASCSPTPKATPAGAEVGPSARRRCDECTARLSRRFSALRDAGKRPCVANAAVARELGCWVWEIGRRAEGSIPS